MICADVRELLADYQDGGPGPAERREIEKHLDRCDSCNKDVADLRSLGRLLRSMPEIPAPEGFTVSVLARARRSDRHEPPSARIWKKVAVVAASLTFVSIGVAGWMMFNQSAAPSSEVDDRSGHVGVSALVERDGVSLG